MSSEWHEGWDPVQKNLLIELKTKLFEYGESYSTWNPKDWAKLIKVKISFWLRTINYAPSIGPQPIISWPCLIGFGRPSLWLKAITTLSITVLIWFTLQITLDARIALIILSSTAAEFGLGLDSRYTPFPPRYDIAEASRNEQHGNSTIFETERKETKKFSAIMKTRTLARISSQLSEFLGLPNSSSQSWFLLLCYLRQYSCCLSYRCRESWHRLWW